MFEAFVDSSFDRQIEDIKALVAIPSVSRGTPEEGMPLGRPMHEALEQTFAIARRLGIDNCRSLDGYCGYVDFGDADEQLLIISHLDVVPADCGWTFDPFGGTVSDDERGGERADEERAS